jgi:hypothetical protein
MRGSASIGSSSNKNKNNNNNNNNNILRPTPCVGMGIIRIISAWIACENAMAGAFLLVLFRKVSRGFPFRRLCVDVGTHLDQQLDDILMPLRRC